MSAVAPAPVFSPAEIDWLVSEGFLVDDEQAYTLIDTLPAGSWEFVITRHNNDLDLHLLVTRDLGYRSYRHTDKLGTKTRIFRCCLDLIHGIRNGDLV